MDIEVDRGKTFPLPLLGVSSGLEAYFDCQTADYRGFHILRATIRDQDGKRYVFVLQHDESWKASKGLGKLRKGPQVRALGLSALPQNETKAILDNLGWLK